MLCITSFTIVLILGGGPAATTLEVAIYQALRFDFDPARAVAVTFLQIGLTAGVLLVLTRLGGNTAIDANLPVAPRRYGRVGRGEAIANAALVAAALLFVAGPMVATVAAGLQADLYRLAADGAVHKAAVDQHRIVHAFGRPVGIACLVSGGCKAGAVAIDGVVGRGMA